MYTDSKHWVQYKDDLSRQHLMKDWIGVLYTKKYLNDKRYIRVRDLSIFCSDYRSKRDKVVRDGFTVKKIISRLHINYY